MAINTIITFNSFIDSHYITLTHKLIVNKQHWE